MIEIHWHEHMYIHERKHNFYLLFLPSFCWEQFFPQDRGLYLEWLQSVAEMRMQKAEQDPSPTKIEPLVTLLDKLGAYSHTHTPTHLHTHLPTHTHTYTHTHMHTHSEYTYTHTHTQTHTCTHTHTHTHAHTRWHTLTHTHTKFLHAEAAEKESSCSDNGPLARRHQHLKGHAFEILAKAFKEDGL